MKTSLVNLIVLFSIIKLIQDQDDLSFRNLIINHLDLRYMIMVNDNLLMFIDFPYNNK